MTVIRLILVTLLIGLEVIQCLPLHGRSHRCPRRCPTCTPDNPEALAAQWNTPEDFEDPLASALFHHPRQPFPHYGHPFPHHVPPYRPHEVPPYHPYDVPAPHYAPISYPRHHLFESSSSEPLGDLSTRFERSPDIEDDEQKFFVVYRGDLEHGAPAQRSIPEQPRTLTDRELEEVVTRAIIAAKRLTESENTIYRQPFFEQPSPSNIHLMSERNLRSYQDASSEMLEEEPGRQQQIQQQLMQQQQMEQQQMRQEQIQQQMQQQQIQQQMQQQQIQQQMQQQQQIQQQMQQRAHQAQITMQGHRAHPEHYFREPYGAQSATDHWDTSNFQEIEVENEGQGLHRAEDVRRAQMLHKAQSLHRAQGPEAQQRPEVEEKIEKTVDSQIMDDMVAPPIAKTNKAHETTTPKP